MGMTSFFVRVALLPALLLTPCLIANFLCRRSNRLVLATATTATALLLNLLIPVSMHLLGIPIIPIHLAVVHWLAFSLALLLNTLQSTPHSPLSTLHSLLSTLHPPLSTLSALFLLALLLFPYTHFTGIDTYRWQDLATSVRMEESIPWLAHPLSLLGFTARSYPSAQPLLLATIQILGGLGVEWGFYLLSLWTAFAGFLCAYVFAAKLFPGNALSSQLDGDMTCRNGGATSNAAPRYAGGQRRPLFSPPFCFALLYVLSPVFIRYAHWATGRGVFLAIYPLFLAVVLDLPRLRAWLTLLILLPLLATTHKVGLIAPVVVLLLSASSAVLPRRCHRLMVAAFGFPFLLAAFALVPPAYIPAPAGNILGLLRFSITRFGWMIPVAALGLLGPSDIFAKPAMRRLFPAILIAIPLAYESQMYGALAALPFVVVAAALGVEWISMAVYRSQHRQLSLRVAFGILVLLAVAPTIATVVHRSLIATPEPVHRAAMFLEEYDPEGPFMIHAPGRARTQIQAYVSGCPRFSVVARANPVLTFAHPPPLTGNPRRVLRTWISYARGCLTVPEISTDYYGVNPRHYYFIINGKGNHPTNTTTIYDQDTVRILTPPESNPKIRVR